MPQAKILFIFPKWSERTLWGHFRYKFPSLGLLTIAGLTPPEFDVAFVDENVTPLDFQTAADLVAISVMTPLATRAYEIADQFRARGKPVVLGGIHATALPDEAAAHADAVVVGEGDESWRALLQDFTRGQLQKCYRPKAFSDLQNVPFARRDLLADGRYVTRSTIQLSRGCPYDCEYCSVTAFFGQEFRFRPLDQFVAEFLTLENRFVFIVDDNIVAHRKTAEDLFDRLRGSGKWWGSQVPITVAEDEKLLKKMAASGCKVLFIGFESLSQDNLRLIGKNFVKAAKHAERIRKIQDHGIGIQGSFIVGYDHDDESVFGQLYDFVQATRLESFLTSVLTPFPGTLLTERMEKEGRVLSRDWSRYDMNTVVYQPRHFTPEQLQAGFNELNRALYGVPEILQRTIKPRKHMIIFVPQNFGFRQAWRQLWAGQHG